MFQKKESCRDKATHFMLNKVSSKMLPLMRQCGNIL